MSSDSYDMKVIDSKQPLRIASEAPSKSANSPLRVHTGKRTHWLIFLFCCPIIATSLCCKAFYHGLKDLFLGLGGCVAGFCWAICCQRQEPHNIREDVAAKSLASTHTRFPMAFHLQDDPMHMRVFTVSVRYSVAVSQKAVMACEIGTHYCLDTMLSNVLEPLLQAEVSKCTVANVRDTLRPNLCGLFPDLNAKIAAMGITLEDVHLDEFEEIGRPFGRDVPVEMYDALSKSDVVLVDCKKKHWFGVTPVSVVRLYVDAKCPQPSIQCTGLQASGPEDEKGTLLEGLTSRDLVLSTGDRKIAFNTNQGVMTWNDVVTKSLDRYAAASPLHANIASAAMFRHLNGGVGSDGVSTTTNSATLGPTASSSVIGATNSGGIGGGIMSMFASSSSGGSARSSPEKAHHPNNLSLDIPAGSPKRLTVIAVSPVHGGVINATASVVHSSPINAAASTSGQRPPVTVAVENTPTPGPTTISVVITNPSPNTVVTIPRLDFAALTGKSGSQTGTPINADASSSSTVSNSTASLEPAPSTPNKAPLASIPELFPDTEAVTTTTTTTTTTTVSSSTLTLTFPSEV